MTGNHQVIGTSQMYATEAARESDIARVKADGASKTVKEKI
ncbi:YegP family protein [Rhodoferax sp.]|nr:YegP family protein [Rhodoferax sp.]